MIEAGSAAAASKEALGNPLATHYARLRTWWDALLLVHVLPERPQQVAAMALSVFAGSFDCGGALAVAPRGMQEAGVRRLLNHLQQVSVLQDASGATGERLATLRCGRHQHRR